MFTRGDFWPDLHNLYLSLKSEGDSDPNRRDRILAELHQFPLAVREELTADLAALSAALSGLATQVLNSSNELSSTGSR